MRIQSDSGQARSVGGEDVICGGKFLLAAALRWRDFQFRAFEVPEEQRLSRFVELLATLKELWTGAHVTHEGRHFRIRAAGVEEIIMRCQWPGMPAEDTQQAIERFGREVLPRLVA